MKKSLITAAALVALGVPAAANADAPTQTDRQNAAQECRTERGTTDASREAFAQRYGTNANKRNAFGKCVSSKSKDEAKERTEAQSGASQACRTEQGTTAESKAAFAQKYGTNKNGKNAFGKCVSGKSKELQAAADQADKEAAMARRSAAKTCSTERGTTAESREAFAKKYGTGKTRKNAFGKCVSATAKDRQAA